MAKKHITFLTAKEVAKILRINILTVYDYIKSGGLQSIRLGRTYRIRIEDLNSFVTNHVSTRSKREEKS